MAPPPETAGYKVRSLALHSRSMGGAWLTAAHLQFNHTMIRVKDPKASLKFYVDVSVQH